jgi:hypothetical protein
MGLTVPPIDRWIQAPVIDARMDAVTNTVIRAAPGPPPARVIGHPPRFSSTTTVLLQ